MGAEFDYRIYDGEDLKQIKREWKHDCADDRQVNGWSYTGTIGMFDHAPRWIGQDDCKFSCVENAVEYMEEIHDKWRSPLAVRFGTKNTVGYVIGGWCPC